MTLRVRDDGPVRVLTLDRPDTGNALNTDHVRALAGAVADAMHTPAVRVVVLAATGPTFCVGSDLHAYAAAEAAGSLEPLVARILPILQQTVLRLAEGPKPTVAAVSGPASGVGLDLALACDLRVVADDATLAPGCSAVGLVPEGGTPHHLVRMLGLARARELLLLPGRVVTAAEALRWGLAVELAPRAEVLGRALALARRVAAGPATALRLVKRLLSEDPGRSLGDALEDETASQRVAMADPDAAEGLRAFVARRPPVFGTTGTPPPPVESK